MLSVVMAVALSLLSQTELPIEQKSELTLTKATGTTATYGEMQSLIELVFSAYSAPMPSKIEIHVLRYTEFEELLAKEASPRNWTSWLSQYRQQHRLSYAVQFFDDFETGELIIYTWTTDLDTIIHETIHRVFGSIEIEPGLLNNEDMVRNATLLFQISYMYKEWLRLHR